MGKHQLGIALIFPGVPQVLEFAFTKSLDLAAQGIGNRDGKNNAKGLGPRKNRGLNFLPMTSRAYHDSLFMARIAPVAMLFISCRSGYSHRPDEFASAGDIARGILVLADTLGALSA